jgi:hypothetical protein
MFRGPTAIRPGESVSSLSYFFATVFFATATSALFATRRSFNAATIAA